MAITITTLSGGNTPADGSDPRTFPAIWNATATALEGVADDLDTAEADIAALKYLVETTEQTADYTLALADVNKVVNMNKSGTGEVVVPTNSSVAFPIGSVVGVYNQSSDDVEIVGDAGVTVRNAGTLAQYAEVSIRKRATDEWVLAGVVGAPTGS
jgi:hypothetical protein